MQSRYVTLDTMRGVAAIIVLLIHMSPLYDRSHSVGDSQTFIHAGYLAVDVFFALSGFVLSRSYDERLAGGLSYRDFMWSRVVRLFPLYWLGTAIGLVTLGIDLSRGNVMPIPALQTAASAIVMMPSPSTYPNAGLFPLNGPAWSLFFELYVANLAFSAFHQRLKGAVLALTIALSAIAALWTLRHFNTMNVGWDWQNGWGGFPRVLFSFFAGVGLHRLHRQYGAPKVPAPIIIILMCASFFVSWDAHRRLPEALFVVAMYPVLIYLGASALERRPAIGKAAGELSFAVYAIHSPLIYLLVQLQPVLGWHPSPLTAATFFVLVLAVAAGADRYFDPPARRLLRQAIDRVRSFTSPAAAIALDPRT